MKTFLFGCALWAVGCSSGSYEDSSSSDSNMTVQQIAQEHRDRREANTPVPTWNEAEAAEALRQSLALHAIRVTKAIALDSDAFGTFRTERFFGRVAAKPEVAGAKLEDAVCTISSSSSTLPEGAVYIATVTASTVTKLFVAGTDWETHGSYVPDMTFQLHLTLRDPAAMDAPPDAYFDCKRDTASLLDAYYFELEAS